MSDPASDTNGTGPDLTGPGPETSGAGPDLTGGKLPVASAAETARTLVRYLRGGRWGALVAVVATTAGAGSALVAPFLVGRIVDAVISGDATPAGLAGNAFVAVLAATAGAALGALGLSRLTAVSEVVLAQLRERVVERGLSMKLTEVEAIGSGALLSRLVGDVSVASDAVRGVLPALVSSVLNILVSIGGVFFLDWRIALAGALPLPIWVLSARSYLRRCTPLYAADREAETELSRPLLSSVQGARTVRALGLEEPHQEVIADRSWRWAVATLRAAAARSRLSATLNGMELVGLLSVLIAGFLLYRAGELTIGAVSAAVLLFLRTFEPITQLMFVLDQVQSGMSALNRLVGIAGAPSVPAPASLTALRHPPGVNLRGVRFGYAQDVEVLRGVDLTVPPGRTAALVGTSGAGKSTIAGILARLHVPGAGEVTLDGLDLGRADPARIALLPQERHVFSGSIAWNLRLVAPGATDEQLVAVLETVGADAWVAALPDGLATVVGSTGRQLSASQAQQLALARLVLKDPLLVLLDEPLAETDEGSHLIRHGVRAALRGRTGVIIAHRLAEAADADEVLVLDRGRVVERGPHDELLAAGGHYADLWAAWLRGRPTADGARAVLPGSGLPRGDT